MFSPLSSSKQTAYWGSSKPSLESGLLALRQIWLQDLKRTSFSHGPTFSKRASLTPTGFADGWNVRNLQSNGFLLSPKPCFSPLRSIMSEDSAFAPFWKKWKEKGGEALLGCYQLSTGNLVLFRFTAEIAEGGESTPVLSVPFQGFAQFDCSFKDSALFLLVFGKRLQQDLPRQLPSLLNLLLVSIEIVIRGHYLLLNRHIQMPLLSQSFLTPRGPYWICYYKPHP